MTPTQLVGRGPRWKSRFFRGVVCDTRERNAIRCAPQPSKTNKKEKPKKKKEEKKQQGKIR